MRGYYLHLLDSPDERYRAYSAQLTSYNCDFAAQLHNRTTPAQRQQAVEKFKGWEADLRALVANGGERELKARSAGRAPPTARPAR